MLSYKIFISTSTKSAFCNSCRLRPWAHIASYLFRAVWLVYSTIHVSTVLDLAELRYLRDPKLTVRVQRGWSGSLTNKRGRGIPARRM